MAVSHNKLREMLGHSKTDDKVAVAMGQGIKDGFENLVGCSFDKGFYSPNNKR
jgi:IS5 family transposase